MAAVLAAAAAACAVIAGLSFYTAHRIMTGNGIIPLTTRPETLGLPYEKVECVTADGITLRGWFIPAKEPSSRTLLFCHGWGANKGEILRDTHGLRDRGYNLLYFDFRACGESSGKLLSVGCLESADFDAIVAFLRRFRPNDKYGVYGMSMGAMISFSGAARHGIFSASVVESPFRSHDEAVIRYLRYHSGMPYYPLLPVILGVLRWRMGRDPQQGSPESVAPTFRTPVFGVAGTGDRIAAPELTEALLARVPAPHEVWIVPDAAHARVAEKAGPEYVDRLARFYDAHMGAPAS